jgi:hypothetical protein
MYSIISIALLSALALFPFQADAHNIRGNHRHGGYNSHGKGSHAPSEPAGIPPPAAGDSPCETGVIAPFACRSGRLYRLPHSECRGQILVCISPS